MQTPEEQPPIERAVRLCEELGGIARGLRFDLAQRELAARIPDPEATARRAAALNAEIELYQASDRDWPRF